MIEQPEKIARLEAATRGAVAGFLARGVPPDEIRRSVVRSAVAGMVGKASDLDVEHAVAVVQRIVDEALKGADRVRSRGDSDGN